MSIVALEGQPFEATSEGSASGLIGTIGVRVVTDAGVVAIARTTANIIELVAGSGIYSWSCSAAPAVPGAYSVVWDDGSGHFTAEDLAVVVSLPVVAPVLPSTVATVAQAVQQTQRCVRGRAFVAAYTFGLDGDALPDSATTVSVTVINAGGYTIVSGATATLDAVSGGQQTATLAFAAGLTPSRDLFTCLWVATIGGVAVTQVSQVDVCDSRLFPLSDYTQFTELMNFSGALQEQRRMEAEDFLERECGMAFTGRYRSQQFTLTEPPDLTWWPDAPSGAWGGDAQSYGRTKLILDRPFVQAVRSILSTTLDDLGNATTTALSTTFSRYDAANGVLYYRDNLDNGIFGDAVVGYEHGRFIPDVRRVCLILARHRLLNGPLDARAVQMPAEGGGVIRLQSTSGAAVTGLTEVDEFVARYNQRSLGFVSGL